MPLDALNLSKGPIDGKIDVYSDWPAALVTGTGAIPKPRLRVDPGQTAFWEGRQFSTFHEFNLVTGTSLWGRFVAPVDVVVVKRSITVVQGNLRFALSSGGTPSGTWTAKTVFGVNNMAERPTPLYVQQVAASFGGSVAGGTESAVVVLETAAAQAVTVDRAADEVGLAAGTYYVEIRNTGGGNLRGLYEVLWEERQPASPLIY